MKSKPNLSSLNVDDATKRSGVDEILQNYKQAITDFCETSPEKLNDELDQFLLYVAKTGDTLVDWDKMQKVFILKLKLVLDEFYKSQPYKAGKIHANCETDPYEDMKERLVQLTEKFESPPFTMQRLCELITNPRKNYTKCEKFMRALEKNLMVVTSWNYPTRRNSESSTEQVNGVFEARISFGAVDRPWAALPHSPIATTPPTLPPLQQAPINDDNRTPEAESEEVSKPDDAKANVSTDVQQKEETESGKVQLLSSENTETSEKSHPSSEVEASDKDIAPSLKPKDSEAAGTSKQLVMTGDTGVVALTNTEKDALKEPLPGVGTLVEKHSVKSNVSESPTLYQMPVQAAEQTEIFPISPAKRKLEDEEIPLEMSPNTKRLKSDSEDPPPTSDEKSHA